MAQSQFILSGHYLSPTGPQDPYPLSSLLPTKEYKLQEDLVIQL